MKITYGNILFVLSLLLLSCNEYQKVEIKFNTIHKSIESFDSYVIRVSNTNDLKGVVVKKMEDHLWIVEFPKSRNAEVFIDLYSKEFLLNQEIISSSFKSDTLIEFTISPKEYYFNEKNAKLDLKRNNLKLVVSDEEVYDVFVNNKLNDIYGFELVYFPVDIYTKNSSGIFEYNNIVGSYIFSQDSLKSETLSKTIDSLMYLRIDYTFQKDLEYDLIDCCKLAHIYIDEDIRIEKNEEIRRLFRNSIKKEAINYDIFLNQVSTSKDYSWLFKLNYLLVDDYSKIIPQLISWITDNVEIGLRNSADLIIPERVKSGDLKAYGHGGIVDDDLFKLSGRANHLLKEYTGEDFGRVSMYSSNDELKRLKNRWIFWYCNQAKEVNLIMGVTNEKIKNYSFLSVMYNDDYYPDFLVEKGRNILLNLCIKIEVEKPRNLEELYILTHNAVLEFNDLNENFMKNESEIETVAREAIAFDFEFIANSYSFNPDIEYLIGPRDW